MAYHGSAGSGNPVGKVMSLMIIAIPVGLLVQVGLLKLLLIAAGGILILALIVGLLHKEGGQG